MSVFGVSEVNQRKYAAPASRPARAAYGRKISRRISSWLEGAEEIRSNYKVLAVAIPSKLILPSNITLVEQGKECSPFGVSISIFKDIRRLYWYFGPASRQLHHFKLLRQIGSTTEWL